MKQAIDAEALKRQILFTPLDTKEALKDWIQVFLDLDMPNCIVDPESNSSPMDSLWDVYDRCRRNDPEEYSHILSYASRMSFKTLNSAILEILMVLHLGRSVAHMAAIEPQAKKAQEYVKKFLRRPILREFVVGNNQRKVEVVRYVHQDTGSILSPKEHSSLDRVEQDKYKCLSYYIVIVICTLAGSNSEHVPFMCVDEIDVVSNPLAYQEAQAIPDSSEGNTPVTLLTSTRKFAFGLVQQEIDKAHESGLEIRHWNIIDVTEKCPVSRHRPDLPKLTIYRSDDSLKAISEREYGDLPTEQKEKFVKDQGFDGCLNNCKMFAFCRGRLATHQKSDSPLLKKIPQIQKQFAKFSPEMAKAQLLCLKPSSEGMIYPRLDRDVHMLTAAQIATKVTGEEFPPDFGKGQLIELLKSREVRWFSGMDFGYTHNFAVITGARDGTRLFVLDTIIQPELDLGQMINACNERIKPFNPIIYADSEDPGRIQTLKRAGFHIRPAPKPAGSVVGGIEIVRLKLWPAIGQPELFFLAGDEGVEFLFKQMQSYHWKTDAAGRVTNDPIKEDDDAVDALRYLIMNVFAPKGHMAVPKSEENGLAMPPTKLQEKQVAAHNWNQILEHVGLAGNKDPLSEEQSTGVKSKGKRGGFTWDL